MVFFTTLSTFVFLNFFQPFGIYHKEEISTQDVFVDLFVAMGFVFVVLITSQFVIRPLFNSYKSTIFGILLLFLTEAVLSSGVWTLLNVYAPNVTVVKRNLFHLWFENFIGYIAIMCLPYFLFIAYIYIKDKQSVVIEKAKEKVDILQTIAINDETGETKLLLNIDNLLYIQSADNYVEVNYLEDNSAQKILIRNSLKNIETEFLNTPIIRCHRSFMLNTKKIESAKKTTAGFEVKLKELTNTSIPVSRSYVSELRKYT